MGKSDSESRFVNFTDLGFDIDKIASDSRYDPALMDFDDDPPEEQEKGDGGVPRPTVIQLGITAWSSPVKGPCPVCGGEGADLSKGPIEERYCGYCDRYGLDDQEARANLSIRHMANQTPAKKKKTKKEEQR